MVDSDLEFKTESVEVSGQISVSVEYALEHENDKVRLYIRYEGGPTDDLGFFPSITDLDDDRELELVRTWTKYVFETKKFEFVRALKGEKG